MKHNKINNIQNLGQSIWLDFLDRKIMTSGELEKLINEDGVRGMTSNPSIFERAITNSSDYDEDIAVLFKQKNRNDDIFLELAVSDIKRAADSFKSVFMKTNGNDGYVSIEVSPRLAHDTEGTINQARRLWKAINRKNVMIKIPSTLEGLPAIRRCISEGININVTLLFDLQRYKEVINAYVLGLKDRVSNNQPINDIASVASFFLSRIDVMIDPLLEKKGLNELKGQVAIACAKKAYDIYKNAFVSDAFKKLSARGARPQRLLWASTSSKDPSFSDVKYVEALIGPETINTLSMETLQAFNDHGHSENRLGENLTKATLLLSSLKENGIDINNITQQLEDDGLRKFNKAYDSLEDAIEKRGTVLS
ncbi:MAG TPA: transaldolase [Cyclobacteriaceae bacterium]|nr:transaldolase [Cyclobacteriaceae bacterium]